MVPKKSVVWKHFTKSANGTATCKICFKVLKTSGNTSNLLGHINKQHSLNKIDIDGSVDLDNSELHDTSMQVEISTPSQVNSELHMELPVKKAKIIASEHEKQGTLITAFTNMNSFKEGGKKYLQITHTILYMICKDMLPLSTVEHDGFKRLFNIVAPLYKIPSRRYFTRILDDKYEVLHNHVKEKLSRIQTCVLTTDVWTDSHTTQSYLGVTIHYLENVTMKSAIFGVYMLNERHDHVYLGNILNQACSDFGISHDNIIAIVTDNGANIVKAITETFGKSKHLPCFAHTLNLIPEKAFQKCTEVNTVLEKVRTIVKWFRQSVVAADELRAVQNNSKNVLKPILDVSTRWNSKFYMLERFIHLIKYINEVLLNNPKAPGMLSGGELELIKEIKEVLAPLELVTKEISGQNYTTISKIIPLVRCMEAKLKDIVINNEVALTFKDAILSEISKRFGQVEHNSNIAIATILDPRYKKLDFQDPFAVGRAVENIKFMLKSNDAESEAIQPSLSNSSSSFTADENSQSLWDHHKKLAESFNNRGIHDNSHEDQNLIISAEISQYLNAPVNNLHEDPFVVWEKYKMVYPKLYFLARKFLQITATSVPSERLFSETGNILTDQRNRLTPERLNKLLFLSSLDYEDWHYVNLC